MSTWIRSIREESLALLWMVARTDLETPARPRPVGAGAIGSTMSDPQSSPAAVPSTRVLSENVAVPKDGRLDDPTHESSYHSRRHGNRRENFSTREYADSVADLIRQRLSPRRTHSQPASRPVIHRDFTFGGVELTQDGPELRLWIWFGWHGVGNTHRAEVDFARFKAGTDDAGGGPELCVSFILQELEEDLTAGPSTSFDDSRGADWGLGFK